MAQYLPVSQICCHGQRRTNKGLNLPLENTKNNTFFQQAQLVNTEIGTKSLLSGLVGQNLYLMSISS